MGDPGWSVTAPSGDVVAASETKLAATLAGLTRPERSSDDGSDCAGASEPDFEFDAGH